MKATMILSALLFSFQAMASEAWTLAAADASCKTYGVKPGDTCWSIMKSTNATFAQIISWNSDLDRQCGNITNFEGKDICISNPEGNYAIPSNSHGIPTIVTTTAPIPTPTPNETEDRCAEFHLVKAGEDCSDFMVKYEITKKDFLFLNPHVWENCTNVYLDYYYCVRPVGYISTYPGYLPTTSTKEFVQTPSTKLPIKPDPLAGYEDKEPIPIADKTRHDCLQYLSLTNLTETPDLAKCWSLVTVFGITPEEFILWNPSLAQNDTNGTATDDYTYPCTISESSSYCVALEEPTAVPDDGAVAPPSPRAAGEIENCTAWFAPQEYHNCEDVLLTVWLSIDEFYFMNPSIKSDCSGLTLNTYYCISIDKDGGPPTSLPIPSATATTTGTSKATGTGISTPSPVQDGIAKTCNDFYLVESGDVCGDIAKDHGISRADFDKWNPDVKSDCTGLIAEYYVCVGVSGASATATKTSAGTSKTSTATSKAPSTTTGAAATPSPVQEAMVKTCNAFYLVKAGDGCYAIAEAEGIKLADFYKWNPDVKDDCSGLLSDFYVCVGVK